MDPRRNSDMSAPSPRMLEKRHSDYNLFRHGSMSKWTPEELQRHTLNLQKQITMVAQQNLRLQEKQAESQAGSFNKNARRNSDMSAPSPRMLEKRHSDYNLFRHGSMS